MMTRSTGHVRFPDGEVKHFIVNNTIGLVWPRLFESAREAQDLADDTYGKGDLARVSTGFYPPDDYTPENRWHVEFYLEGDHWWGWATKEYVHYPTLIEDYIEIGRKSVPEPGWVR